MPVEVRGEQHRAACCIQPSSPVLAHPASVHDNTRVATSNPPLSPASSHAQPDGLPVPRRYWSIVTIVLAISMTVLDSTIANVALPSIARDFQASNAASIWVV